MSHAFPAPVPLPRQLGAELLGTFLLTATVLGSGEMGQRLAGGNAALALLPGSLMTGGVLMALIRALGALSGAHFNPVVTLASAAEQGTPWRHVPGFVGAQAVGALLGAVAAHAMFGLPWVAAGTVERAGAPLWWSEVVGTFGLLVVIWGCARHDAASLPASVGAYVAAGYWFTASTGFTNPAVTLARTISLTPGGMRPQDAPAYMLAQLLGAGLATLLFRWLSPRAR